MKWLVFVLSLSTLAHAESEIREKLSELHELRTNIRRAVFEKSRFTDELARIQIEMEKQNEKVSSLKTDQNQLKEKIFERATGLYKLHKLQPKGSVLQLVGSHDFLKKSFYLKYLNQQDRRLVQDYNIKSDTILKEQAQYKKRQAYFQKMQLKSQQRHKDLINQEKKQRDLISYIKQSVQKQEPGASQNTFFSEKRGKLKAPANGTMVSRFGLKRDRQTDLNYLETGVYYLTSEQTDVVTVAPGEVLYLDQIPGWGLTLIIDHGEFYYSIYSHIKDPSVRPGDKVQDNQKLAVVGRSSYDNTKSLYFEIRHFSEPQDPTEWIERGIL